MAVKRPAPEPAVVSLLSKPGDDNEIVNVRIAKKPRIEFNRDEFPPLIAAGFGGDDEGLDLRNRLSSFLPALKAADEQLEKEKLDGRISERRIEIDSDEDGDSDASSSSSSSSSDDDEEEDEDEDDSGSGRDNSSEDSDLTEEEEEEDNHDHPPLLPPNIAEILISNLLSQSTAPTDNVEQSSIKRKRRKKGASQPYIEMNLGLGVLEEIKPTDDTADGDDAEAGDRRRLIDRILELRRMQEIGESAARDDGIDKSGDDVSNDETSLQQDEEVLLKGLKSGNTDGKKVFIEELE